jgi:hypothetical protein
MSRNWRITTMDNLKARSDEDLRRGHVETAIADGRIEGFPPPSRPEIAIYDAYIRGELRADKLVDAYLQQLKP